MDLMFYSKSMCAIAGFWVEKRYGLIKILKELPWKLLTKEGGWKAIIEADIAIRDLLY